MSHGGCRCKGRGIGTITIMFCWAINLSQAHLLKSSNGERFYLEKRTFIVLASSKNVIFAMIKKVGLMDKIIQLDSPDRYCELYGLENYNPLVSVVELDRATCAVDGVTNFGFYALFLKHEKCGEMQYGMTTYDYNEGTIVSIGPGQVVRCQAPAGRRPRCTALLFDKKLVAGTSLGRKMSRYTFFSYKSNEALHMTDQERATVIDCLDKIRIESEQPTDHHSRDIIVMNIELLLEYCMRYYDRQFTTREITSRGVLERFEQLLEDYMHSGATQATGLPTVKYFADKICLSPNYFGDLIKKLTGKSAQDIILDKIVDLGKEMLLGTDKPVTDIAYDLGFQYAQHFSRFFKKKTGCTPLEYRNSKP